MGCATDLMCASGNCFFNPFDDDDDGTCIVMIRWWGWVLIVLGAIILCALICILCVCCFRKKRNNRLTRKLDEANMYEGQGNYKQVPVMQYPDQ